MKSNELAALMLTWANKEEELQALEWQIEAEILSRKETVNVGTVRASYRSAKQTFDYAKAVADWLDEGSNAYVEAVRQRTKTITKTDWKGICDDENIEQTNIPVTLGEPSVSIKIMKGETK